MGHGARSFAWILMATAGWACASAAGRGSTDECRSDRAADRRPLRAVADSAALQDAVQVFWTRETGPTLAAVVYDSTGALDTVRVHTAAAALPVAEVGRRVAEAARPRADTVGVIWVLMGDEAGPRVRRLARIQMCGPEILNRNWISKRLSEEVKRLGLRESLTVGMEVMVHTDGRVSDVRVRESSGNVEADHIAGVISRGISFRPALLEGIPTPVFTRFPVTFGVRN